MPLPKQLQGVDVAAAQAKLDANIEKAFEYIRKTNANANEALKSENYYEEFNKLAEPTTDMSPEDLMAVLAGLDFLITAAPVLRQALVEGFTERWLKKLMNKENDNG